MALGPRCRKGTGPAKSQGFPSDDRVAAGRRGHTQQKCWFAGRSGDPEPSGAGGRQQSREDIAEVVLGIRTMTVSAASLWLVDDTQETGEPAGQADSDPWAPVTWPGFFPRRDRL